VADKPDPVATSQRLAKPELPARFYKEAVAGTHDAGFALLLDGKVAKTPGRKPLAVSSRRVAEAMAAEWSAQGERIDPATMPMTRVVNAAIDRVAGEMTAVRGDIVKYSGSDLICYRAEEPESLIEAQAKRWDPLVTWAREALGARLVVAAGIVHAAQEPATATAIAKALEPLDALRLAAVHTVTTLTGSAIIALAVLKGRLTVQQAWEAAYADEDWQMSRWGRDEAALSARAKRFTEMQAAGLILAA
jgi:chaperone required for assembly of F1-ATPase